MCIWPLHRCKEWFSGTILWDQALAFIQDWGKMYLQMLKVIISIVDILSFHLEYFNVFQCSLLENMVSFASKHSGKLPPNFVQIEEIPLGCYPPPWWKSALICCKVRTQRLVLQLGTSSFPFFKALYGFPAILGQFCGITQVHTVITFLKS